MKFIKNKKIILIIISVVFISFFSKIVFAVWDGLPYDPGEISNPECLPSQINCDVLPAVTTEADPIFIASEAFTITGMDTTDWNTAYGWGNHTIAGYVTGTPWVTMGYVTGTPWTTMGYITDGNIGWDNSYGFITSYTETDPIFTAWDKSTGVNITESQISDLQNYLTSYTETDPIYISSQAHNITSTDITNLSHLSGINNGDETNSTIKTKLGVATNSNDGYLSSIDWTTFNNKQPAGSYLTSFTETDPVFTASPSSSISLSDLTNIGNLSGVNTGDQNLSGLIPYVGGTTNVDLGINNLTVDTNTFFVDSVNHRVGIGTTSPGQKLDVSGNINVNTNGTNALVSTYMGANSNGYNIWIGGGGQNSTGQVGATYKGSYNVSLGYQALYSNTSGNYNVGLGYQALYSNTSGVNNSAFGYQALYSNTSGGNNSAFGYQALELNVDGGNNIAFGNNALKQNNSNGNTAIGTSSLGNNTSGSTNTAIGFLSMVGNVTGYNNSALGFNSFRFNYNGYNNVAFGYDAGSFVYEYEGEDNANMSSNDSIFIGSNTKSRITGSVNEIVIGATAIGFGSNSVVIGNDSILKTILKGNVGINMTIDNDINYALQLPNNVTQKAKANAWDTYASSIKWKTEVEQIPSALDKIMNVRGINYTWNKGDAMDGIKGTGITAEDLDTLGIYGVTTKNQNGEYDSVNLTPVIAISVEGIKELNLKLENIATPLDDTNKSFIERFYEKMIAWLGSPDNGLEQICVKKSDGL
ncbi:MAG: tail fiber domain-containing protein [Candidatus Paceibacterota bacterium]